MNLLSVQAVSKRYNGVSALDDVDLSVPAGSRTAVVGPSGSGKTTLLRIIAGFEAPDSGSVAIDGRIFANGTSAVPAHLRGIGYVPQDGALFPHLSVADNIGFGLARSEPRRDETILALMDSVELDGRMLKSRPHELSGGQQQRVALARALARQPKLMLLDEPFSALDAGLRESMRKAVARVLSAAGITSILVTHDQAEALSFADQVAVLREGRLVQAGSPRELYLSPKDRATAAFLGDAILLPADVEDGVALCCLGRVAVDAAGLHGPAEIMLRPEQVRLLPAADPSASDDPAAPSGEVTEVEFGGAASVVAVAVGHSELSPVMSLTIRSSSHDLPPVGSRVRFALSGKAHVFARPSSLMSEPRR
jgi:iron(III) transport system ATP-binding protein